MKSGDLFFGHEHSLVSQPFDDAAGLVAEHVGFSKDDFDLLPFVEAIVRHVHETFVEIALPNVKCAKNVRMVQPGVQNWEGPRGPAGEEDPFFGDFVFAFDLRDDGEDLCVVFALKLSLFFRRRRHAPFG